MTKKLFEKVPIKSGNPVTFYFVRHGESEGNALGAQCLVNNDCPLNEVGKADIQKIAEYFKQQNIAVSDVYSSDLDRTRQTAEAIANAYNLPVKIKTDLTERNWGDWGGMVWEEVAKKLSVMDIEDRYTFVPPNGESWQHMEERVFKALEEIAEENTEGEHIVIVTHKGVLRSVLPVLAEAGKEKHEDFTVKTGSITAFGFHKKDFHFVGLKPEFD